MMKGSGSELPKRFVFDHLNFDSSATNLRPDSNQTVSDLVSIMKCYPNSTVQLEGHIDSAMDAAMNHKLPLDRLRERLARHQREKSSILASIASPSASAVQMQKDMGRYFEVDQEIRKIVAELRATAPEITVLPCSDAPPKPRHRLNPDSTIDSICILCFATIASGHCVEDLEAVERAHVCDPDALRRYYKWFS